MHATRLVECIDPNKILFSEEASRHTLSGRQTLNHKHDITLTEQICSCLDLQDVHLRVCCTSGTLRSARARPKCSRTMSKCSMRIPMSLARRWCAAVMSLPSYLSVPPSAYVRKVACIVQGIVFARMGVSLIFFAHPIDICKPMLSSSVNQSCLGHLLGILPAFWNGVCDPQNASDSINDSASKPSTL